MPFVPILKVWEELFFQKSIGILELDHSFSKNMVGGERNEKVICKYTYLAVFNTMFVGL